MNVFSRSAMRSLVAPAWTRSASMSHVAADEATVGFVGLGNMGLPMASNLLKTGYKLAVCDRVPAAVEKLTSQGAFACSTPRQLSELPNIRAIITMLPSTDAVREVYQGADGILSASNGLNAEVLIDSSTIYPQYVRELAAAVAAAPVQHHSAGGTGFVDAPVSGGVPGARAGTLTFMCGGAPSALLRAEPLLLAMGKRSIECGPAGAGQIAKVANNLTLAIQMAAVSEGLALGQALGIDPRTLSQVFNTSSARCWSSEVYNPCPGVMEDVPAARDYTPGFTTQLCLKDVGLALQAAEEVGAATPMGKVVVELYKQVRDSAAPEVVDFSAIYKLVYGGRPAGQ